MMTQPSPPAPFDTAQGRPLPARERGEDVEQIPVRCPRCGAVLGRLVRRRGVPTLLSEGWFVSAGERLCPDCRGVFVVRPVKAGWEELVRRFLERNRLNGDVGELELDT